MKSERDTLDETSPVDVDTGQIRRELTESADDLVAEVERRRGLTAREAELLHDVAEVLVARLPGMLRERPDNLRLAELENRVRVLEQYRLALTGVSDENGRLGKLDRTIAHLREEMLAGDVAVRVAFAAGDAELRADVGTREERKAERAAAQVVNGISRRAKIVLGLVVSAALGGSGFAVWKAWRAGVANDARLEQRLHQYDVDIDRLYGFSRVPRPDPTKE